MSPPPHVLHHSFLAIHGSHSRIEVKEADTKQIDDEERSYEAAVARKSRTVTQAVCGESPWRPMRWWWWTMQWRHLAHWTSFLLGCSVRLW
jgi:hypothetical protein